MLTENKKDFIKFMLNCNVLQFGNFTTKSGRQTPYFINTGNYKTGKQLQILSEFIANEIVTSKCRFDACFGPAYKGIPLVVGCCEALFRKYDIDKPFFFNRKEKKDHGEGGFLIGYTPKTDDRIIIIEDVLTAGTAINETVPKLKEKFEITISNLFITVDRHEKIKNSDIGATEKIFKQFEIKSHSIVNIYDIKNFIENNSKFQKHMSQMNEYIEKYCIAPDSNKIKT